MGGSGAFSSWLPARRWQVGIAVAALLVAVWLWPGAPTQIAPTQVDDPQAVTDAKAGLPTTSPPGQALTLPTALPPLRVAHDADPPSGPLPPARYFELQSEATCRCQVRDVAAERLKFELIACQALMRNMAELDRAALEGIAAGRVAYDPAAAARCLRESTACGDGHSDETACADVLRGRVQVGGVCHDTVDCTSGFCVKLSSADATGLCQAKSAVGSPCTNFWDCFPGDVAALQCIAGTCQRPPIRAGERCELTCGTEGLWCDTDAKPPICRPALGQNASCNPENGGQCREGLACRTGPSGSRCAAPGQREEPCDPERIHDICDRDLYCVPVAGGGRCLPKVELAEPCAGDRQCRRSDSAYCAGSTATKPGSCKALPVGGEPCAERMIEGSRCRIPFVCDVVRQICVENLAVGDPCEGRLCGGLPFAITCVHGVCRARQPEGAPCETEAEGSSAEGELRCERKLECVAGRCVKP